MQRDQSATGQINILVLLCGFLGLSTVGFGVFSVIAYNRATDDRAALEQVRLEAYSQGKRDQQKIDEDRFGEEQKTPFRSYLAPDTFGAFELKVPKTWNIYVVEDDGAKTQVNLLAHPNYIKNISSTVNRYALRVEMVQQLTPVVLEKYAKAIKKGELTTSAVKVSGIEGTRLDGQIEKEIKGSVVLVPVRDKTMVFSNEDDQFKEDFEHVLAQSKINP